MRILATYLLAMVICSAALGSFAADIPDSHENRLAAAKKYLEAVPMKNMAQDFISETAKNIPESKKQSYIQLMTNAFRVDALEGASIEAMTKHFTVKELDALTTFYGAPEGRSIMKKFGAYTADIMPVIQQEALRAQRLIESALQEKQ
jgi:hypothetical protein